MSTFSIENFENLPLAIQDTMAAMFKSRNAVKKASEANVSTTDRMVTIALAADSETSLAEAFDDVFLSIKSDGRVATRVGAKKRDKAGKNGERYTVPQTFMNMKSVLCGALRREVAFLDDEGNQRSYSAIRKDNAALVAEEKADKLTGDDAVRAQAHEYLATLATAVDAASDVDLTELAETLCTIAAGARLDPASDDLALVA